METPWGFGVHRSLENIDNRQIFFYGRAGFGRKFKAKRRATPA
jgi:hypothetical protein